MSSFLDEVRIDDQKRPCDLSVAMRKMDGDLKDELRSALAESSISGAAIARVLQKRGFDVSEGSLRRCRRICPCWRS